MSFTSAWRVLQVLEQHRQYFDPPPANSSEILFDMITTQSFTIPGSLIMEYVVMQEYFATRIASSSHTLRHHASFCVVFLNLLLLEVLKSVIFKKTVLDTIVLSSVSQQYIPNRDASQTSEKYTRYTVVC